MMAGYFPQILQPIVAAPEPLQAINFLKQNGLLKQSLQCPHCRSRCTWSVRKGKKDGFGWRCLSQGCDHYGSFFSIRDQSFFAKSHIPLQKWVHLMFLWCNGERQIQAANITGISRKSLVDVYNFLREVCVVYFQNNPITLGGPGVVCQIDECQFQSKPKHHRGRQLGAQAVWVFGIVDTSTNPGIGYMEVVGRRDAQTLLPIVQRVCLPGTIIYSDQWAGFLICVYSVIGPYMDNVEIDQSGQGLQSRLANLRSSLIYKATSFFCWPGAFVKIYVVWVKSTNFQTSMIPKLK